MSACYAAQLARMGCPEECQVELEAYALPFDFVQDLTRQKNFSFIRLVEFLRKYSDLVPGLVTSYAAGGWVAVFSYVVANAGDLTNIVVDFLAIFGQ